MKVARLRKEQRVKKKDRTIKTIIPKQALGADGFVLMTEGVKKRS
ncbi:hypothetical protein [Echinicola shivajiensis]|nr:hypothetical protein [Echinicola shivajiensis]